MVTIKERIGYTLVVQSTDNLAQDFQAWSNLLEEEYIRIGDALGVVVISNEGDILEPLEAWRLVFYMYATMSRWPAFPICIVGESSKYVEEMKPVGELFDVYQIGGALTVEDAAQWVTSWFADNELDREQLYQKISGGITSNIHVDVALRRVAERASDRLEEIDTQLNNIHKQMILIASEPHCTGYFWKDKKAGGQNWRVLHRTSQLPCPIHGDSNLRIKDSRRYREAEQKIRLGEQKKTLESELNQLSEQRNRIVNPVFLLFRESLL